jgi:hypothetical protein
MYYLTDDERWEIWKSMSHDIRIGCLKKYFTVEEYKKLIEGCPPGIDKEEYIMYCDLTRKRVCEISKMAERFSIAIGMFLEESYYDDKSRNLLSSEH